jgi:hypothetical protein
MVLGRSLIAEARRLRRGAFSAEEIQGKLGRSLNRALKTAACLKPLLVPVLSAESHDRQTLDPLVDLVVAECRLVFFEALAPQPDHDILTVPLCSRPLASPIEPHSAIRDSILLQRRF